MVIYIMPKGTENNESRRKNNVDRRTIRVGASVFHYWVKHYEEPSIYGYEEGRASKISLRRNGKTVFNFDRGMDIPPEDEETETALAILLKQYN